MPCYEYFITKQEQKVLTIIEFEYSTSFRGCFFLILLTKILNIKLKKKNKLKLKLKKKNKRNINKNLLRRYNFAMKY